MLKCDHSSENRGKYGQGLSGDNETNMYLANITRKSAKPSLSFSWLSSVANKGPKLLRMGKFSTQANTVYFPNDANNSEKHCLLCDSSSRKDWENSNNPSPVYDAQGLFWSIIVLALELKLLRNGSKWRGFVAAIFTKNALDDVITRIWLGSNQLVTIFPLQLEVKSTLKLRVAGRIGVVLSRVPQTSAKREVNAERVTRDARQWQR